MSNPYQVIKDFEQALCDYTGAPYAVAVNSCTNALLLACKWHLREDSPHFLDNAVFSCNGSYSKTIEIPKKTYIGVPMSIINAGGEVCFRDEDWVGAYQLKPYNILDSARWFEMGMYVKGLMQCVSFHATKTLGDTQGGAILHDNPKADEWFRKARFDGRTEGVDPKDDHFDMIGYHCMMTSDVAARLLVKLSSLPAHNDPLPNSDYPDLSQFEVFK